MSISGTVNLTIEFTTFTCTCGMQYALSAAYVAKRRDDHESWYCPGCGDGRHFPQESETEKLRKRLARQTHCCEQQTARAESLRAERDHLEHRVNGYKGALARAKKAAP